MIFLQLRRGKNMDFEELPLASAPTRFRQSNCGQRGVPPDETLACDDGRARNRKDKNSKRRYTAGVKRLCEIRSERRIWIGERLLKL